MNLHIAKPRDDARLCFTEHVGIEKIRDKTDLDIDITSRLVVLMLSIS